MQFIRVYYSKLRSRVYSNDDSQEWKESRMTARQFEKTVRMVLESYRNYNITDCKVWKENNQIYFTLKLGPDRFRTESWAVSAVFDKSGKLLKSSYGSRRDYMFARILMKRIEEACTGTEKRQA